MHYPSIVKQWMGETLAKTNKISCWHAESYPLNKILMFKLSGSYSLLFEVLWWKVLFDIMHDILIAPNQHFELWLITGLEDLRLKLDMFSCGERYVTINSYRYVWSGNCLQHMWTELKCLNRLRRGTGHCKLFLHKCGYF